MNNETVFDNNQFVVSYELLQLLQWLVDYEPDTLKALISQALDDGLHEQILNSHDTDAPAISTSELQQSVVDFFMLLEDGMQDAPDNDEETRRAHKSMIPSIDHIDTSICDETTLSTSIAQATSQIRGNTGKSAKEALCRELLKNWNPQKKQQLN